MNQPLEFSLFDRNGQRKYLTNSERQNFAKFSKTRELEKRLFLLTLLHSGARISEVLSLKPSQLDLSEKVIIIESMKKRRKGVFRVIPLPLSLIKSISRIAKIKKSNDLIWSYSRRTATRYVEAIMLEAEIIGVQGSAKGLRHGFAVCAIQNNVPLNLVKNWMGHSSLAVTEIYLNVVGKEERAFAERMW